MKNRIKLAIVYYVDIDNNAKATSTAVSVANAGKKGTAAIAKALLSSTPDGESVLATVPASHIFIEQVNEEGNVVKSVKVDQFSTEETEKKLKTKKASTAKGGFDVTSLL